MNGQNPELNYQSFLADVIRDYLDYLDHLGFSIEPQASNLRRIDGFLVETTSAACNSATTGFGSGYCSISRPSQRLYLAWLANCFSWVLPLPGAPGMDD